MELIIDIDEQHFELLQMAVINGMGDNAQKIIAQGTPLPKGHGRLIDESKIRTINHYHIEKCLVGNFYHDLMFDVETDSPTIIEADKEQTE